MKKILYFCSSTPYIIDDGIKKINKNLIQEIISKKYDITLIVPNDKIPTPTYLSKIKIIKYEKKRTILKMIKSLFSLEPLYFGLYFDKELLSKINKQDFDLIFYDFYPLTQYTSNLSHEVFMMPDSMKELAMSEFKNETKIIKKIYLFINYLLSITYNKKIHHIKKLYVSNEDIKIDNIKKSYFFKIPADNNDYSIYHKNEINKNEILFRGIMSFEPNITSITTFYKEIFIDLIKKYPNIKLKIIGKNPSIKLKNQLINKCEITGYVEDIIKEMSKSGIHIAPMTSGSGVKTKILDSISIKRLVIATPKAIHGIFDNIQEARNYGIIIYENKEEFFYYFDKITQDNFQYNEYVNKAYDYLMENSYEKKINELFAIANESSNENEK